MSKTLVMLAAALLARRCPSGFVHQGCIVLLHNYTAILQRDGQISRLPGLSVLVRHSTPLDGKAVFGCAYATH